MAKIFALKCNLTRTRSRGGHEFFDIGFPMSAPFSPVGSILVVMKSSFLEKNRQSFQWGSIPDNGGVKYGFLSHLPSKSYKDYRLGYDDFLEVLRSFVSLDREEQLRVLRKQPSEHFCRLLQHKVHKQVIDGMLANPAEAARRVEFCLNSGFEVAEGDIVRVFVPNTYNAILNRDNMVLSKEKLVHYNPRYTVIQAMMASFDIRNWSV
ncbi:hypothetical protein H9Q16_18740 [Sulfitobacter sp. TSTF-M16]|uniref:Uncharacterized protein n=1 Tax=Sulfitobacter aestuariivivens TaxID=2766981 RepID=A0A927HI77_9RHOB|nr:hypothetical protein [Sulfitobacter aestuariivivens]MBD3665980.1 hypothetical protein [Sulfitobacter aestuariivivens]